MNRLPQTANLGSAARLNRGEEGSGTLLAVLLITGIFAAGVLLTTIAVAHQAHWRVQTAADLGAIAGATAWQTGFEPCLTAGETVERNGSTLINCELFGTGGVKVTAQRELGLLGVRQITATARASPRLPS